MRYVILTLLTPLTAFVGFVVGLLVAMQLGILLAGNYEHFSPDFGAGGARVVGMILIYGGAVIGALVPWLVGLAYRYRIR